MKPNFQNAIESFRVTRGSMTSKPGDNFGAFMFPRGKSMLRVVAAPPAPNVTGWEHVSVSVAYMTSSGKRKLRTPSWEEMCEVKDIFFSKEEAVIQFHPPASEYVNFHPHTLHLWKWGDGRFPLPDSILVGPSGNHEKDATQLKRYLETENERRE